MLDPAVRDLVRRGYAAIGARDLSAIQGYFTPDAEVESQFSQVGGRVYRGEAGIAEWIDDLADAWETLSVELEDAAQVAGGMVVVLYTLRGRGRGSGMEIEVQVAQELTLRGMQVARVRRLDRGEAERRLASGLPRVATFDCYGTLIDWEGGLGTFLYSLARRNGDARPEPGSVLRARWEEIQFRLITEGDWRRYHDVLTDALREWCGERGYRWNDNDGRALAESMQAWQPFPDTVPALRAAREAGLRLVIVSNTDRDIIEHSLRQMDVPFDDVQTAEDVRAYKPDEHVFRQALERVDEPPEHVLHVAFGFKYDIGPAQRLGMRTAWVNRRADPPPGPERPEFEWRDLWGLAEAAGARP